MSDALREGYATGSGRPVDSHERNREPYELFACLNAMTLLEDWYRQFDLDEHVPGAVRALRREFHRLA